MYNIYSSYPPELYHHGIKGQKWGVRRFQNYDGSRIKKGQFIIKKKIHESHDLLTLEKH